MASNLSRLVIHQIFVVFVLRLAFFVASEISLIWKERTVAEVGWPGSYL